MKAALALLLLASPAPALGAPLTVRTGEAWVFTIRDGEPARARRVASSAKPPKGQIKVSVSAVMGTTMMVTNNSPVAYTFRAELLQDGKPTAARACTLPANGRPIFEQWQQKAEAVRISRFKQATVVGTC